MIENVQLKFGPSGNAAPLIFNPHAVTIFVGPNNSGKSLALREIGQYCYTGRANAGFLILAQVTFSVPAANFAEIELERLKVIPTLSENVPQGDTLIGVFSNRFSVPTGNFLQVLSHPNGNPQQFTNWWLRFYVLTLDGPSRIQLINSQHRGDLLNPSTAFARLFTNDEKRSQLRRVLHDAFGLYFVLDASQGDQLGIRYSPIEPHHNERALTDDVLAYLRAAIPIEQYSDGVKAFTGILIQTWAGDPRIVLVDEPEAFLHPSLAFKLGKEISRATLEAGKRVFAATHSPQFVMGAIQSGSPVNIIRLTHTVERSTARLLPNDQIVQLMRNPLLRSVGVISALFYDYVVVTEGDSDRAFYSEINERLLTFDPARGISDVLFLNARNKQTVSNIIGPLRSLGIPTAAILDIDVLKDGGVEWKRHLIAAGIPEAEHQGLADLRRQIWEAFDATGRDPKRDGGCDLLQGGIREAAINLAEKLEEYGYFLVRGGELESWLSRFGIARNKSTWLSALFERMGENPDSPDYVRPSEGDVWDFNGSIRAWLTDPIRKGIPGV